jgi:hypothetical protein
MRLMRGTKGRYGCRSSLSWQCAGLPAHVSTRTPERLCRDSAEIGNDASGDLHIYVVDNLWRQ